MQVHFSAVFLCAFSNMTPNRISFKLTIFLSCLFYFFFKKKAKWSQKSMNIFNQWQLRLEHPGAQSPESCHTLTHMKGCQIMSNGFSPGFSKTSSYVFGVSSSSSLPFTCAICLCLMCTCVYLCACVHIWKVLISLESWVKYEELGDFIKSMEWWSSSQPCNTFIHPQTLIQHNNSPRSLAISRPLPVFHLIFAICNVKPCISRHSSGRTGGDGWEMESRSGLWKHDLFACVLYSRIKLHKNKTHAHNTHLGARAHTKSIYGPDNWVSETDDSAHGDVPTIRDDSSLWFQLQSLFHHLCIHSKHRATSLLFNTKLSHRFLLGGLSHRLCSKQHLMVWKVKPTGLKVTFRAIPLRSACDWLQKSEIYFLLPVTLPAAVVTVPFFLSFKHQIHAL